MKFLSPRLKNESPAPSKPPHEHAEFEDDVIARGLAFDLRVLAVHDKNVLGEANEGAEIGFVESLKKILDRVVPDLEDSIRPGVHVCIVIQNRCHSIGMFQAAYRRTYEQFQLVSHAASRARPAFA